MIIPFCILKVLKHLAESSPDSKVRKYLDSIPITKLFNPSVTKQVGSEESQYRMEQTSDDEKNAYSATSPTQSSNVDTENSILSVEIPLMKAIHYIPEESFAETNSDQFEDSGSEYIPSTTSFEESSDNEISDYANNDNTNGFSINNTKHVEDKFEQKKSFVKDFTTNNSIVEVSIYYDFLLQTNKLNYVSDFST